MTETKTVQTKTKTYTVGEAVVLEAKAQALLEDLTVERTTAMALHDSFMSQLYTNPELEVTDELVHRFYSFADAEQKQKSLINSLMRAVALQEGAVTPLKFDFKDPTNLKLAYREWAKDEFTEVTVDMLHQAVGFSSLINSMKTFGTELSGTPPAYLGESWRQVGAPCAKVTLTDPLPVPEEPVTEEWFDNHPVVVHALASARAYYKAKPKLPFNMSLVSDGTETAFTFPDNVPDQERFANIVRNMVDEFEIDPATTFTATTGVLSTETSEEEEQSTPTFGLTLNLATLVDTVAIGGSKSYAVNLETMELTARDFIPHSITAGEIIKQVEVAA